MIVLVKKLVMLLTELHSKSEILNEFPVQIALPKSEEVFWKSKSKSGEKKHNFLTIKNIPKYLDVSLLTKNNFRIKKYSSIKGYAICLDNYLDTKGYLQYQFNSKSRKKITKPIRRLEMSFDITYRRFIGDIRKDECSYLMDSLKKMIIKRFKERNQKNDALKHWSWIQNNIYPLIKAKKASLYVIYHKEKPLSISLGYHYGSIYFSYITSYDINYYRFGLGNIMIYKKIELCFENNYRFLEMGWGDLDYKRRWSNHIHNLNHYVIFPKNSFLAPLIALWEGNKTRIIVYLKSGSFNTIIKKVKILFVKKPNHIKDVNGYSFIDIEKSNSHNNYIPINIENKGRVNFKVILNDFIYKTEEYYLDVKIYKSPSEEFYIIKGQKHCKQVIINA